jgi:hypothetical protein
VRRLALVAAVLVVPVLPVLAATPAFAATNVICVPVKLAGCDTFAPSISQAITAANASDSDDVIKVAPGTYNDGPYQLNGVAHRVTLQGAGQGSTFLTLPAAGTHTYLSAAQATVQDLTITMAPNVLLASDIGLFLSNGSLAERVTVNGPGTYNDRGLNSVNSQVKSSTVLMPVSDGYSRGVYSDGGSTITDSIITGAQGFVHSGTTTDTLSRVTIRTSKAGVLLDSGTVTIDDAVVDLGTSDGTGLSATNGNDGTDPMTINAVHLSVVGGGGGSKGVVAAATSAGAKQTATITLADSIVRGPVTSLIASASNGLAVNPANRSTATVTVSYSDYQTVSPTSEIATNGAGGVVLGAGNVVNVDPGFVNVGAGNYHLTPGSLVADKGDPAAGGPATDRDGSARVLDGDAVIGAVRDLGAYELPAVVRPPATVPDTTAPDTTITTKLAKRITKKKVKIVFSSEAGATFQCQVDGKAWQACTSPLKLKVKQGKHTVLVRAVDAAGNVDATPAKVKFKRVPKQR